MIMSFSQLRAEWLTAGGAPKDADTMAAIAMAESHGRLGDHNAGDPYGGSWCAWQINGAHRGAFNMPGLTHDPYLCALAAVYVRHKQGLNAWSTHRYGQYWTFMPHHHAHAVRAHEHRHHAGHRASTQHAARLGHHHKPAGDLTAMGSVNHLGVCFIGGAAMLAAFNGLRVLKRQFVLAIEEEIAAGKRYNRRRRYREEAALKRRTMPRSQRRAALAANAC